MIERGGDRWKVIGPLLERGQDFLIRLKGRRHLEWRRLTLSVWNLAARVRRHFEETVVKEEESEEKAYVLRFGSTSARFPGFERNLWLVVVDGLGE